MRRTKCRLNAKRGCGGDLARDLDRAVELLSRRGHILNETEPVGLFGSPFIAGQHVTHRTAPTCLANECDCRTAGREMTSRHFSLSEHCIAGSNTDIGSEKKLVACPLGLALHSDNERFLSMRRYRADRIEEFACFREATGAQDRRPACGIEGASDKVGALGIEDPDTQGFIVIEKIVRTA